MIFAVPKPFPKIATACAVAGVLVLCKLGYWQQERLVWKNALQASLDAEFSRDATSIPLTSAELMNLPEQAIKRGTVKGRFDFDHQVMLRGQISEKKSVNYVLIPFMTLDKKTLFVVAGYQDGLEPVPEPGIRPDTDTVTGAARLPHWSSFVPENAPAQDIWYRADPEQIAAHSKLPDPLPALLYLERSNYKMDSMPRVEITRVLRNDHRQYAIFWYMMAGILTAIYFLRFWRKPNAAIGS